jgi:uncharacterized protein YjbJ (UPF0337 family)
MNKDELDGKVDQLKGKVKQATGDLTDNERLHDEGVADEAAGDVQEGFGRGRRKASASSVNVAARPRAPNSTGVRGQGWRLHRDPDFCYPRKVLVGPGTPYLGPDAKAHSDYELRARARSGNGFGSTRRVTLGPIPSERSESRSINNFIG